MTECSAMPGQCKLLVMATSKERLSIYVAIAFFAGVLVMTLFFWLMYSQRWLVYRNCPREIRTCAGDDYYDDPQAALAAGHDLTPRLTIENDKLRYRRPVRNTDCRPSSNPVTIDYPMYCLLDGEIYRSRFAGSSSYISANGTVRRFDAHCHLDGRRGSPLAKWDAGA